LVVLQKRTLREEDWGDGGDGVTICETFDKTSELLPRLHGGGAPKTHPTGGRWW